MGFDDALMSNVDMKIYFIRIYIFNVVVGCQRALCNRAAHLSGRSEGQGASTEPLSNFNAQAGILTGPRAAAALLASFRGTTTKDTFALICIAADGMNLRLPAV